MRERSSAVPAGAGQGPAKPSFVATDKSCGNRSRFAQSTSSRTSPTEHTFRRHLGRVLEHARFTSPTHVVRNRHVREEGIVLGKPPHPAHLRRKGNAGSRHPRPRPRHSFSGRSQPAITRRAVVLPQPKGHSQRLASSIARSNPPAQSPDRIVWRVWRLNREISMKVSGSEVGGGPSCFRTRQRSASGKSPSAVADQIPRQGLESSAAQQGWPGLLHGRRNQPAPPGGREAAARSP